MRNSEYDPLKSRNTRLAARMALRGRSGLDVEGDSEAMVRSQAVNHGQPGRMETPPVASHEGLKCFYDDSQVVNSYLENRITQPFGSVLHGRQVGFLAKIIGPLPKSRILDLAPGPARVSAELSPSGLAVAVDFSPKMLEAARRRLAAARKRWDLIRGDGYHLPFAARSFDCVYSLRFIRRFELQYRELLYSEIRRVLRTDGLFIMDAQNRLIALPHRLARGLERYPVFDELFLRDELIRELEENGFRVLEVEGIMRRFALQFRLNRLRRIRLSGLARLLIQLLEHSNDRNPSTWMVLCQKRKH